MARTRAQALEVTRQVLAAQFCCDPGDFLRDGNTVTEAGLRPGRMPFYLGRPHLALATFGAGVVATASPEWVKWIGRVLAGLGRDEIFSMPCLGRIERRVRRSGQPLAGPQQRYVSAADLWRAVPPPEGVEVECVEAGPRMDPLYELGFGHALGQKYQGERPDKVAAVARRDGRVIGLAAASADHPRLWQVGVGVAPECRGGGVGAAAVAACTRAVLDRGAVPYYSTHLSHLRSQAAALRCGFVPAWSEAYVYVPRPLRVEGDYLGLERG